MYMDFHAHCSKRGCFIYGNEHEDPQILAESKLFPKLMSLNSVNFDFRGSVFNDCENNSVDWQGDSRCGSGRAVISRETGHHPLVYTIEANYARGKSINHLRRRYDRFNDRQMPESSEIQDSLSSLYGKTYQFRELPESKKLKSVKSPAPEFCPEIWQDVGQSVLYALLDYDHINPYSRLITGINDNLEHKVDVIRSKLKQNIENKN